MDNLHSRSLNLNRNNNQLEGEEQQGADPLAGSNLDQRDLDEQARQLQKVVVLNHKKIHPPQGIKQGTK